MSVTANLMVEGFQQGSGDSIPYVNITPHALKTITTPVAPPRLYKKDNKTEAFLSSLNLSVIPAAT